MSGEKASKAHSADAAALGFWYQSLYALLTLVEKTTDDAAIGIEQLDDVELTADGKTLLYQLKHSVAKTPQPISIKSRSLWKTMKVWIDALPSLSLAETTFHLVTVAGIAADDPLVAATDPLSDRSDLSQAMSEEAERVRDAWVAAKKAGKPLPFVDRIDGCEAFLALDDTDRLNLLRRVAICAESPAVPEVEEQIAKTLHILPADQRPPVVQRLVEWWDRQVLYSLCQKRERIISRTEIQAQISAIIADLDQGKLLPDFETVNQPEDYQPDGMLARQIGLVKGKRSDLEKAIREEWKAREQRARWVEGNPAMSSKIHEYDLVLKEHWSDRHVQLVEDCEDKEDAGKCRSGLELLRWTHNEAPTTVRPIAEGWGAAYYVRGSYQVLAINLEVGWHPDFKTLLEDAE